MVWLIDVDDEKPSIGETVQALSIGGKLCEVQWRKDSHEFFKAWMPHPKVPKKVKDKLSALYASGKSWGNHGTEVRRDGDAQ